MRICSAIRENSMTGKDDKWVNIKNLRGWISQESVQENQRGYEMKKHALFIGENH